MEALSSDEKREAFLSATGGHHAAGRARWAAHAATGLTDEELTDALRRALGIFGGSGGPGKLHIVYQGNGLKIWAARKVINHVTTPPVFSGAASVAMAREVYGITDPADNQMSLF